MSTVVMKFGGSSVADIERLNKVAAHVAARALSGTGVVVVVSAMGKTTDALIAQAQQVAREPSRRELDMLMTTGERAAASLLTMALIERGADAISFTGSQSGILTNDTHAGASVLEVRPYRVQDELARGRVVVIAGFQGVSYRKEVTTLGRGGSDTTAVALAAALDADCEIYSDVDGIWTADPRVVQDAKKIDALIHEEMQELAAAGAKVLNAQAVQFAKAKGIAIYALKTPHFHTGTDELTGTVVRKDAPTPVGGVRGVAHRTRLHVLMADGVPRLPMLLKHLEQHALPSGQVVAVGPQVQVLVPPEDAHGLDGACAALPVGCRREADVGAVSLVGQGMLDDKATLMAALAAMEQVNIAVLGVSTSSFRVTLLISPAQTEQAARVLHERFIQR
jgi:aspartate kinase